MTSFGFPRCVRLLNSRDYQQVFNDAKVRVSDKHLLILARPNQLSHPRVGLVIAKKTIRLATQRNRVKRIIRDSFRLTSHQLPPMDIVVLSRRGLGELDNGSLHELFSRSWIRLDKYAGRLT
jgi:ribonuclease P protein component